MADTRSVRPLGLITKLGIVVGGHRFKISAVVLDLDALGAYPILLRRPWLRSANIKQSWEHNCISFRRGRTKVRVPTEEAAAQPKDMTPLYVEDINMLEGVDDKELEAYLEEHPRIIPLFKIDVIEVAADYATHNSVKVDAYEPDLASIIELRLVTLLACRYKAMLGHAPSMPLQKCLFYAVFPIMGPSVTIPADNSKENKEGFKRNNTTVFFEKYKKKKTRWKMREIDSEEERMKNT